MVEPNGKTLKVYLLLWGGNMVNIYWLVTFKETWYCYITFFVCCKYINQYSFITTCYCKIKRQFSTIKYYVLNIHYIYELLNFYHVILMGFFWQNYLDYLLILSLSYPVIPNKCIYFLHYCFLIICFIFPPEEYMFI